MASGLAPITHRFTGGWATDFGPGVTGLAPDDRGHVAIPFLTNAEDCLFELDGAPRTAPGTTRLNSAALESGARIKGIFDYWRMGTAGSPSQRRVIQIGTKVYADSGNGTFSEIASGFTAGQVPHFALFDDLLIFATDRPTETAYSWDGTTWQALGGSSPPFAFSTKHHNYHFAAGVASNPSVLYYSSQLDPETWTGGTSGSISINPNDGDMITGIVSHRNELIVFKGPYKGSIHRITGTSNSTWARVQLVEGVGAVWQNSIFKYRDDIGFLWSDGTIRSLAATEKFGDYAEGSLSVAINTNYLKRRVTHNRLRHANAVSDDSRAYIQLPVDGSTENNVTLAMDFRFDPPRWSKLPSFNRSCMCLAIDSNASNRQQVFFGGSDGFVEIWGQEARSLPGSTALAYLVTTPYFDYGDFGDMHTLHQIAMELMPRNNSNVTVRWRRDGATAQSMTIAQGGSDPLGGTTGFTLGNAAGTTGSTLADDRFVGRFGQTEEGGEFRSIQYEFAGAILNMQVELHSFQALISRGHPSREN